MTVFHSHLFVHYSHLFSKLKLKKCLKEDAFQTTTEGELLLGAMISWVSHHF